MLLQRSLSKVALGLVSSVIKGMNGPGETLCLLLWHSLSFSQAILHGSRELWAGSFIVWFPPEPVRTCLGSSSWGGRAHHLPPTQPHGFPKHRDRRHSPHPSVFSPISQGVPSCAASVCPLPAPRQLLTLQTDFELM